MLVNGSTVASIKEVFVEVKVQQMKPWASLSSLGWLMDLTRLGFCGFEMKKLLFWGDDMENKDTQP